MEKIRTIILTSGFLLLASCSGIPDNVTDRSSLPQIFPDITGVTIPVNIAPLNFKITVPSEKIIVRFENEDKNLIITGTRKIKIPGRKWRRLLEGSAGSSIRVTLLSKENKTWIRYSPFEIHVNKEPIDQYLVYRRIAPGYESWSEMGIYQRDLASFRESTIIDNRLLPGNCMNCHSFNHNDPDQMMFHLRGNIGATMLVKDEVVTKLNTRTKETGLNCVYPNWHPSGSYIAFSVNKIAQVFHTMKEKRIEVFDTQSDLVVFDIRNNKLITSNLIYTKGSFETFPVFSADGSKLYFCSADTAKMPENFDKVKYSLCSISFDAAGGTFGNSVDTVISWHRTGRSISFPRTSPDGKYLMFTLSDYGNFSLWHRDADLWLLNLADGSINPIDSVNSSEADSFHSWSSGSHWFVFASRRSDGLYTRPYFAWMDENGNTTKPFMLPQKNPDFYDYCLQSFNVPELVTGKVNTDGRKMLKTIGSEAKNVTFEVKE
jgi:Tol biopolymer transport system component